MITLSVVVGIIALCLAFGVVADLLCWFFDVAVALLAVPLAIVAVIVCFALFSGAALVVALPFVLLGVGIGSGLARKQKSRTA